MVSFRLLFLLFLFGVKATAQTDTSLTTSKKPLIEKSGRKTVLDELQDKKNQVKETFSSKENLKKAVKDRTTLSAKAGASASTASGGEAGSSVSPEDLGLKVQPDRRKKKTKKVEGFLRNEYEGIGIVRVVNKIGSGENMVIEEFYVLKDYTDPSPYVKDIFWYDYRASRVMSTPIKDKDYAQILHGPYRRNKGENLEEEGHYFVGTKHARWERFGKDSDGDEGLTDKQYYHKGFPDESVMDYYDPAKKTKLKEVVPKMYGRYSGTYRSFYDGGQLKEEGRLDDSVRVGLWREYHQFGSGGRTKRDTQFGKDKYDRAEGIILREYDNKGKLTFENKEKRKPEEEEGRF